MEVRTLLSATSMSFVSDAMVPDASSIQQGFLQSQFAVVAADSLSPAGYFDLASHSPLGTELAGVTDEYSQFTATADSQVLDSYGDSASQQQAAQTSSSGNDGATIETGSPVETSGGAGEYSVASSSQNMLAGVFGWNSTATGGDPALSSGTPSSSGSNGDFTLGSGTGAQAGFHGGSHDTNYTVTVIDANTTIRTWTFTRSVTYARGKMSSDDVLPSPDIAVEPWTVPESWITDAATPVNGAGSGTGGSGFGPGGTLISDPQSPSGSDGDFEGVRFSATSTVNVTITDTRITMPDGSAGLRKTLSLTWSASVNLGFAGEYSINESDVANSMLPDEEPLPAGMTIDVGGKYKVWLKASVNGELNVSATVPEGGLLSVLSPEFDASFRLGASGAVGGDFKNHEKINLETSTGNEAEETDEYILINIDNSSSGSGIAGCEFWVAISTDDPSPTSDDGSTSVPTGATPDIVPGYVASPTGATQPALTTTVAANRRTGTNPASTLTAERASGVQFSMEISGSFESNNNETSGEKARKQHEFTEGRYAETYEDKTSDVSISSGNLHFIASLGTESRELGFSINFTSTDTVTEKSVLTAVMSPGDVSITDYEVIYSTSRNLGEFNDTSKFSFGVALGADQTGDESDALHIESSTKGFGTSDAWKIARVENYLGFTGDTYFWVEREYLREEWDVTDDLGGPPAGEVGTAELLYSEVGVQTLPTPPAVVMRPINGNGANLEELLSEYRNRQIQLARLQARLDLISDPAMQTYLQGLIATEQSILADIAAEALAAGATPEQLVQITAEAQAAAAEDPIDLQDWDGGESVVSAGLQGGFWGSLQGVANIANGLTDIGIGLLNLAIIGAPGGLALRLAGIAPAIDAPDWSTGLVTDEDPTLHEWSKWLGGNGVFFLAGAAFLRLPGGFRSGDVVNVDIRLLQNPTSQPVPLAQKLAGKGPFNLAKYLDKLPTVEQKKNGVLILMNGVHRIHLARIAALSTGDWILPVRLFIRR